MGSFGVVPPGSSAAGLAIDASSASLFLLVGAVACMICLAPDSHFARHLPACEANGPGVLPWSPLGGGWLAGKYSQDQPTSGATRLGEDPQRGTEAYALRSAQPRTWRVLETLRSIADEHAQPMSCIALAWLTAQSTVSSVILGARTTAQLAHNLTSVEVELTPDDFAALDVASDPEPSAWPYGDAGREQRSRPIL